MNLSLSCWLLAAPRARQLPSLDPDALDQPASDFLLLALRRVGAAKGRPAAKQRAAPEAPAAAAPSGAAAALAAAANTATPAPGPAVRLEPQALKAAAAGAAGPAAAVAAAGTGPLVGLLIKACAQDHERIGQQVRRAVWQQL